MNKEDVRDRIRINLSKLEEKIISKINDSNFNLKEMIFKKYPLYFTNPTLLNPYLKERLDNFFEKYNFSNEKEE